MEELKYIDDIDFTNIEEIVKRAYAKYGKPCAVFQSQQTGNRLYLPPRHDEVHKVRQHTSGQSW